MIINAQTLDLAFKGFKTVYTDAYTAATVDHDKIVMAVPSGSREESYGWLGQFPALREWIGPRHVNDLKSHGFTIVNRTFESTVAVKRNDISDDRLGVFKPMFAEMGLISRRHPEELVFNLLKSGFTTQCFDGTSFFSEDHALEIGGELVTVSNMFPGTSEPWYLLDTSRAIRPIIWQEREGYQFQSITDANDSHVFMNDQYLYGVRARVNAGFGLWQLAFGSKEMLDASSYADARAAMMEFRADGGRLLGIKPTVLVVPPALEAQARLILTAETVNGDSNPWKGTAELIVTPYVKA